MGWGLIGVQDQSKARRSWAEVLDIQLYPELKEEVLKQLTFSLLNVFHSF